MKLPEINLKNVSPIYKGIATLIVTLLVTQYLSIRLFNVVKENEILQVKHEALQLKNQLQNILNHSENATRVISFLVENNFSETYFDSISKQIVTENKFIDALQIIEGNTIVKTFPLEGNEKTIGYKVLEEPKHANEAKISVKRNSLYFEGPIPLIQGGEGVVGRLPIYKKNKLWGFSSVIIRKETLLKAIGFDTNEKLHFCYQVSKVDNPNFAFFKMEKPTDTKVYYQTHLDSGNWQISVWNTSPQYNNRAMQFSILGILFSITLGILIYILTNQPYKLRKIVAEKTHNLEVANKDLEKRAQELIVSNKELI
nr:CHASE domain-containing protein [Flavobacterium sp.]